ncbi:LuxR C-terminal-related transcriptional regulator [Amycolatopsis alkalitolerans]|uniref:HTH luxR-type domain-containing protein n=1 Tax=Amycolatopsis alkalitolerans TaxID=2547244 RepID=A0A5C4LVT3_9PSEU|nr:LuxR C-terminal-related transcriptional regulator [Amycolatopsis alkalitolerans]TNC21885.1 hypothetical protein FG385_26730 [Amycolatopsis alkalitolerans]
MSIEGRTAIRPAVPEPKVSIPPAPRDVVDRRAPRGLVSPDGERNGSRLTVVRAPAGFGKTTMVAAWARERSAAGGEPVAWLTLDESDNEAAMLCAGILHAVGRATGTAGRSGSSRYPVEVAALLVSLAEMVDTQPSRVWLVLDDVHRVTDRPALRVLESLLHWPSRNLRIVVCGRWMPELGLARLSVASRLREIRAADLAFTREETETVVLANGGRLRGDDLGGLMALTEGWPVAVRLAALALPRRGRQAGTVEFLVMADRAVIDYLNREVLSELSADQQELLLTTCVCDTFDSNLATALTGRAGTPEVLRSLLSLDGLVQPSGPDDTYRLHPFLRAHLRARLRRHSPTVLAGLHSIAARWFAVHGDVPAAAVLASRADNVDLAAYLVAEHGVGLLLRGEAALLSTLGGTLPLLITSQAAVGLVLTAAELIAGERAGAELRLAGLTDALRRNGDERVRDLELIVRTHVARLTSDIGPELDELGARMTRISDPDLLIFALVNHGTAVFWQGRRELGGRDLEKAMRMAAARGYDQVVLHCLSHLGGIASANGDFPEMRRIARQALRFAAQRGPELQGACCQAYTVAAWSAYQFLDTEHAAELAALALTLVGPGEDRTVELSARLVADVIGFDQGSDPHATLVRMRRHWATVERGEPVQPDLVAYVAPAEHRMALHLGRIDWAAEVERRAATTLGDSGDVQLLRARTHVYHGRVVAARALLQKVTGEQVRSQVILTRIEAHVLAAVLADRAGERQAATAELRAALELAAPRRALRPFHDAGQDVRRLLGEMGRLDPFAREVLDAIPAAGPGLSTELTPREVQLLRELPSLATIEEIAATLYVSVNTVKTHLRNVYRKLGATSRREAVIVARERGLL